MTRATIHSCSSLSTLRSISLLSTGQAAGPVGQELGTVCVGQTPPPSTLHTPPCCTHSPEYTLSHLRQARKAALERISVSVRVARRRAAGAAAGAPARGCCGPLAAPLPPAPLLLLLSTGAGTMSLGSESAAVMLALAGAIAVRTCLVLCYLYSISGCADKG